MSVMRLIRTPRTRQVVDTAITRPSHVGQFTARPVLHHAEADERTQLRGSVPDRHGLGPSTDRS